ncbi:MAG: hypothetical protein K6T59_01900, partial [Bryobacteraceae bacterium]|nr:hypothetical protein [Bryobacteraceae bacterium]
LHAPALPQGAEQEDAVHLRQLFHLLPLELAEDIRTAGPVQAVPPEGRLGLGQATSPMADQPVAVPD